MNGLRAERDHRRGPRAMGCRKHLRLRQVRRQWEDGHLRLKYSKECREKLRPIGRAKDHRGAGGKVRAKERGEVVGEARNLGVGEKLRRQRRDRRGSGPPGSTTMNAIEKS